MHRTKKRKKAAKKAKDTLEPRVVPPKYVFAQFSADPNPDERWLTASETIEQACDNCESSGGDCNDLIGEYRLVRVVRVRRETQNIVTEVK